MRVLKPFVALSALSNSTSTFFSANHNRQLQEANHTSFFGDCGPANSYGIHECYKDGADAQVLERSADISNCTDAVNKLIDGNGTRSILYNNKIYGIGIDPSRGKTVDIRLSDLVDILYRDPNKPFVLALTGADKISLIKDQDFIARSVFRKDDEEVQLIIDGSGINLGNQWPESGKCIDSWPIIDHDPYKPRFDRMLIKPGEVCKTSANELTATIPKSAMGEDADGGAHLVIMFDNEDMRPGFDTHATIPYDPGIRLIFEFDEASSVPFEALSFDADLPKLLANMLPPKCVQNASYTYSPTPTPQSNATIRPIIYPLSAKTEQENILKTILPVIFGGLTLLAILALTKNSVGEHLVSSDSRFISSGSNKDSEIEMTSTKSPLTEPLIEGSQA